MLGGRPGHWRLIVCRMRPHRWQLAISAIAVGLVTAVAVAVLHSPGRRTRLDIALRSHFTVAKVLVIGDSIAFEAVPATLCGAPVFNAAFPGHRVAHLEREAAGYVSRLAPKRVIIAVGVNDAWRPAGNVAAWARGYGALVERYAAGAEVFLVEINPVAADLIFNGRQMDNMFIAAANVVIRQTAERTGARRVPAPRSAPTRDGLHPDAAGAALWRARLEQAVCGQATPAPP